MRHQIGQGHTNGHCSGMSCQTLRAKRLHACPRDLYKVRISSPTGAQWHHREGNYSQAGFGSLRSSNWHMRQALRGAAGKIQHIALSLLDRPTETPTATLWWLARD
ncbi:hypothetical protein L209DRAFT_569890 [Thermothelomyces heterothallicus CBS 203.75]